MVNIRLALSPYTSNVLGNRDFVDELEERNSWSKAHPCPNMTDTFLRSETHREMMMACELKEAQDRSQPHEDK